MTYYPHESMSVCHACDICRNGEDDDVDDDNSDDDDDAVSSVNVEGCMTV